MFHASRLPLQISARGNRRHNNALRPWVCGQSERSGRWRWRRRWKISSRSRTSRSADIWFRSNRLSAPGFRYLARTSRIEIRKSAWAENSLFAGPLQAPRWLVRPNCRPTFRGGAAVPHYRVVPAPDTLRGTSVIIILIRPTCPPVFPPLASASVWHRPGKVVPAKILSASRAAENCPALLSR